MTQSGYTLVYSPANIADDDLEKIDYILDDLTSSFSGPSSPSNDVPGMVWYDNANKVLRHADSTKSTWRAIFAGSASFKIWAYLNVITAEEGWARDSSATDAVLGLKSSSGIYATGAQVAPSSNWYISGLTVANHAAHTHSMQSHTHSHTHGSGSDLTADGYAKSESATATSGGPSPANTGDPSITLSHNAPVSDGTWRIRAAVGIMVYPNI